MKDNLEQQISFDKEKFLELNNIFLHKFDTSRGEIFWQDYEKITNFTTHLFQTYGQKRVITMKLFHILARTQGVNMASLPTVATDYDFVGDEGIDSIEKFIREL